MKISGIKYSKYQIGIFLIFTLFVIYAGFFIFRTSFVIDGTRYYCLFDDAMVSMRYADKLAHGFGPVWNAGEKPVEGYSNPLWMVIMAGVHLIPIGKAKISLIIQILSVFILFINLIYVKKISSRLSDNNPKVVLSSLLLTAFYLPINTWALIGMETGILMLICSVTSWLIIKNEESKLFSVWMLIIPAIGTLFRLDITFIFLVIILFLLYHYKDSRKKIFMSGMIILAVVILLQFGFRLYYYDQWLPNTYYLKMTGYPILLRITRGIYSTLKFIYFFNPFLFLLPILMVHMNRNRTFLLILLMMLVQLIYSSYVGGDTWEWHGGANRFVSIVMPGFFILLSIALYKIIPLIYGWITDIFRGASKYYKFSYMIIILVCFLNINSLKGPVSLSELFLIETPIGVIDNFHNLKYALELRNILKKEATATVTTAGVIPYFLECNFIDILGKNDEYISHIQSQVSSGIEKYIDFKPGHIKWDYQYSIKKLRPDAVLQQWNDFNEIVEYLNQNYIKVRVKSLDIDVFLLKESKNINWNMIKDGAI